MDGIIESIRPENFEREVLASEKPFLLLCMPRCRELAEQMQLIQDIATAHTQILKVGFLHENFIEAFRRRYEVLGTPTFFIFNGGNEKARMLGLASRESLMAFVSQVHLMS